MCAALIMGVSVFRFAKGLLLVFNPLKPKGFKSTKPVGLHPKKKKNS